MIVRSHRISFIYLLFDCRGSVVPAILPKIILAAIVGVGACLLNKYTDMGGFVPTDFGPFTALGVAISLFLGFHNNASYGRWWEARTLWGRQIIIVRNLCHFLMGTMSDFTPTSSCQDMMSDIGEKKHHSIQYIVHDEKSGVSFDDDSYTSFDSKGNGIVSGDMNNYENDEEKNISHETSSPAFKRCNIYNNKFNIDWRHHILILSIAQTHALRYQLRPKCKQDGDITALDDRDRFLSLSELQYIQGKKNPANTILLLASKVLGEAYRQHSNYINTYTMIHIQSELDKLCEIQTGCERIYNTSLPLAYSLLVHRTTFLYVMLVPFTLAPKIGWWTPIFNAILSYTFFGLDELSRQIQEPFRDEPMCLALSAMSRTVEVDTLEAMGMKTMELLKPQNSILM